MGKRVRKNIPSSSPLLSNCNGVWPQVLGKKKKLMQAALAAFNSPAAFSCSGAALRQGSPKGSGHGQTEPVRDPSEAFVSPSTACQIVPVLGELGWHCRTEAPQACHSSIQATLPPRTHAPAAHASPSCPRGAGKDKYSPTCTPKRGWR